MMMPSGRVVCDNCGGTVRLTHRFTVVHPHGVCDAEVAHWCLQCSQLAAQLLATVQGWLIDDNVRPA